MKLNPTEAEAVNPGRILILSDGKPGHVNQSIAFARHVGYDYDVVSVRFKKRIGKALSYLFDRVGIYTRRLFDTEIVVGEYRAVVSAGSETYYANRTLAKQLKCKAIAIMLPRSYRFCFDLIVAQQHDNPPSRVNIVSVPINLSYVEPQGIVKPQTGRKYISLIVGGDSQYGRLDSLLLKSQIDKIFRLFPEHKVWMTTSRRTPKVVEEMLREFIYERAVYYSQEAVNPIPDFLQHSEYVFLTADSSSMISEAVSFGVSCIEVLPFSEESAKNRKFDKLIDVLSENNSLHLFIQHVGHASNKINLSDTLSGVQL